MSIDNQSLVIEEEILIKWLKSNLPTSSMKGLKLDNNWHPYKVNAKSNLAVTVYGKEIDDSVKESFWKQLKRIAKSKFLLYKERVSSYKSVRKQTKDVALKENVNTEISCCICMKSHDEPHNPLRPISLGARKDISDNIQPHYLFQYYLLKNLGVIPEDPRKDIYVHYKCAKSACPDIICPFTGLIVQGRDFTIGDITISKKAREQFFPQDTNKRVSELERLISILESFGIAFTGVIYLLEYSENKKHDYSTPFPELSSNFKTVPIDETGNISGIFIGSKASIYEIQIAFLRFLLKRRTDDLLNGDNEDDGETILTKLLFYEWIQAELIRRISNNNKYVEYYLEKLSKSIPELTSNIKKIITELPPENWTRLCD